MTEEELALDKRRTFRRRAALLSLVVTMVVITGIWLSVDLYPTPVGPRQPIPFSHRVHAGDKKIGCFVCHPEAMRASTAGIPPIERCMHCHTRIAPAFEPIRIVKAHFVQNKPIEWVRVNKLPDFVYFNHSMHVFRSIDCGQCHGDVRRMDRIVQVRQLSMGFCISCHRAYNAKTDCFSCHR